MALGGEAPGNRQTVTVIQRATSEPTAGEYRPEVPRFSIAPSSQHLEPRQIRGGSPANASPVGSR
jgi:hypothetical protein